MTPNPFDEETSGTTALLSDTNVPPDHRIRMLRHIFTEDGDVAEKLRHYVLKRLSVADGKEQYAKKVAEWNTRINDLQAGPVRLGIVINKVPCSNRYEVVLEDGTPIFPVLADPELQDELHDGEGVLVDAGGKAILGLGPGLPRRGDEAELLRALDDGHVEVFFHEHEKKIYKASETLAEQIEAGQAKPGSALLVCPRRLIAYSVIPQADGLGYFQYLDRSGLPEVYADRDIGNPHPCLAEWADHIRTELTAPEIHRRFRIRRTITRLLVGSRGTGKTLHIEAFIRMLAEVLSEITGAPVDDLPSRVVRMNMAQILSKWLGDSDKHLNRYFDEVIELYDQVFVAPDGTEYHLPVIAICEEADALSRVRGSDTEAVFDRIQTVALRRLDMTRGDFKDRVIVFLFTSNVPHLLDSAFIRRAGGAIDEFGRLNNARAFRSVLSKHLHGLPLASNNGHSPEELEGLTAERITSWLYSPNSDDPGQIDVTLASSTEPVRKYRRCFMNGALIDRAVQQASTAACRAEKAGLDHGLTLAGLARAFDQQVRGIVNRLTEHNVTDYVDLPDGQRVTRVHKIPQSPSLPQDLMREESP